MKLKISFKHFDHSPAVDARIKEKSEKLNKFFDGNCRISWTCYLNDGNHYAEIEVYGPKFKYHAKANHENMYKSFDLVVDKIEKQLSKKKDKWKNNIHRVKDPVIMDPEFAWLEYDEDAS